MINFKAVTEEIKKILDKQTRGYEITRNEERNEDPDRAAVTDETKKGWIGIYRNKASYDALVSGRWQALIDVDVEIQVANMQSGEKAEDDLQTAEKEILDVLTKNIPTSSAANKNTTLNGRVSQLVDISIRYDFNTAEEIYFHAAVITLTYEIAKVDPG
jgi:hypothetical protein